METDAKIAVIQAFMEKVGQLASHPESRTLIVPERNYRLFKALHLADQHADRLRAAGANWRRVKRERNKEFQRHWRKGASNV